ncbi:hypothetical protein [Mahella australiensis]|uniref:EXLDI protein n=1 Tax=Mahella australiensis (strain DSM 15567 / CIP 107919 / 50-1 BON) TaxID=697281 RepID=F3ZXL0_MAHA5|nr:hypothetical protein [Mahella australiensis]AEE97691.1 hypothetical protein Mahau_2542 [Mahella australiensis 50-1 BON]
MPTKTIYVKEEDMPIFERAAEIAGDSLSSIITDAVRDYVRRKESEDSGMREIILEIGTWPNHGDSNTKKVAFTGVSLGEMTLFKGQTNSRDDRGVDWELYLTKKGKYVVYRRVWSRWQNESSYAEYYILDELPGTDNMIKTKDGEYIEIPAGLVQTAREKEGRMVEILDI